jgi:hypothetical protein
MRTTLGQLKSLIKEAVLEKLDGQSVVTIGIEDVDICLENTGGGGKMLGGEDDKFIFVPYSVSSSLASEKLLKHTAAKKGASLLNLVRQGLAQITPFDVITAAKKGKWLNDESNVLVVRKNDGVLNHLVEKCGNLIANRFNAEKLKVDAVYDVDSGTSTMSRDLARYVAKQLNMPVITGEEGGLKKASVPGEISVDYDKVEQEYKDKSKKQTDLVFNLLDKAEQKINALLASGKKVSISTDVNPASIRRYFKGMQQVTDPEKVKSYKHILVIDDNVDQNVTMKDIRNHLRSVAPDAKFSFAAGVKLPSNKKDKRD